MPCGEHLAEQGNLSNTEEEVNILYHFILKGFFPWSIRIVHFKLQEPGQLAKNQVNLPTFIFPFIGTCQTVPVTGSAPLSISDSSVQENQ